MGELSRWRTDRCSRESLRRSCPVGAAGGLGLLVGWGCWAGAAVAWWVFGACSGSRGPHYVTWACVRHIGAHGSRGVDASRDDSGSAVVGAVLRARALLKMGRIDGSKRLRRGG